VADQVHDLAPEEVAKGMAEGRYLLVDVREPNEVAVEAYPGAALVPLSSFDPQDIPDPVASRWCLPAAQGNGR
jgi:rhodanese-related sulfurtransferase